MINEDCIKSYSSNRILPVYVSLSNVAEWIEKDLSIFRIHLYANIVLNAIVTIERNRKNIELAGNSEIVKYLKRVVQMFGLNPNENFDKIFEKLKDAHGELLNKLTYNPHQILERATHSEKISTKASVGKYGLQLTLDELLEQFEEKQVQFIGRMLSSENASSFLIEFFALLKAILDNNYTLLLMERMFGSFEGSANRSFPAVEISSWFNNLRCNSELRLLLRFGSIPLQSHTTPLK